MAHSARGGGPADDDYVAQQPTSEQRAAVSREMTNMLHKRIEGIMYQFKVRKDGLELDADGATSVRYSAVANRRLDEPGDSSNAPSSNKSSRQHRSQPRSGVTPGGGDGRGPGGGSGDTDMRLKRRTSVSGSEDGGAPDPRALQKAKRLRALKTFLHDAESKLMGRMVDAVTFRITAAGVPVQPFELPVRPILQYAGESIRCPYSEAHFKKFLTCKRSCSMLRHLFWFVHCYCFQSDSQQLQEHLLSLVSRDYVALLGLVTRNKDYFFENFPYAMAFAVCTGFHHFVPGSRSRFTPAWRLQVYVLVCRVLCGMDVCAVTVQRMQETLFEDEGPAGDAEKDGAIKARRLRRRQPSSPLAKTKLEPPKDGWESLPGNAWNERLGALRQLPRELALPALDQTKLNLSGPGAREPNPPPKVVIADSASTTSSDGGDHDPAAPDKAPVVVPQGRQLRLAFSASSISGLVQRYLGTRTETGKTNVTLKRTAPVPWVRVGGVDTFHPELASDRSLTLHSLQQRHGAKLDEFKEANRQERKALRSELGAIRSRREDVLQGGVSCVSKFCLDLSDSKADQQMAAKDKRKGKSGSLSSSDAIVSRYRNTREERLAAHLNTLPAPSLLTSHYSASGAPMYPHGAGDGHTRSQGVLTPSHSSFAGGHAASASTLPGGASGRSSHNTGSPYASSGGRRSLSGAAATAKAVMQSPN